MEAKVVADEKTKKCTKCKTNKPIDLFGKSKISKDGYSYECKECHNDRYKKYVDGLKASRLCGKCGRENDREGKATCSHCAAKDLVHHQKRWLRRKESGTCPYCGEHVLKGHTMCYTCLVKKRKYNKEKVEQFSKKVGNYYDNSCQICGLESSDYEVFACHHLDPKKKKCEVSQMKNMNWRTKVILELEKCCYLCLMCHARVHAHRFDEDLASGELILIPGKVESPQRLKAVGE